ncbi:Ribose-phosphate pyrophosphokinase 4-like protein [Drosera capensis]
MKKHPTADALARILSRILVSGARPMDLVIYDLHELDLSKSICVEQTIVAFTTLNYSVIQRLVSFIHVSVAFPDDGAQETFHELFLEFPCTMKFYAFPDFLLEDCSRGREPCWLSCCHCRGPTLIECQKVLTANGAKEVSAYVTHAFFPTAHGKGSENAFSHFWFTDSCPVTVKAIENIALFKILSLVRSIADTLIDEDDASMLSEPEKALAPVI